ncbi:hypothetical protein MMC29_003610 [Sticta canariensis]|nr:hypothetical protein [Sticta canariensis]
MHLPDASAINPSRCQMQQGLSSPALPSGGMVAGKLITKHSPGLAGSAAREAHALPAQFGQGSGERLRTEAYTAPAADRACLWAHTLPLGSDTRWHTVLPVAPGLPARAQVTHALHALLLQPPPA